MRACARISVYISSVNICLFQVVQIIVSEIYIAIVHNGIRLTCIRSVHIIRRLYIYVGF